MDFDDIFSKCPQWDQEQVNRVWGGSKNLGDMGLSYLGGGLHFPNVFLVVNDAISALYLAFLLK